MTREEWARSLPNPIKPAQIVERMTAAREATLPEAVAIMTSKQVNMPLSLADADRDSQKLIEGAKLFMQHQPETTWALDSEAGQNGLRIGLALFDGLDDLRRVAMGAPKVEKIYDPRDTAREVAAAAKSAANAVPTLALIAGILYLAHHFGDD